MSIIIRLQQLPWSASAADVREFFRGLLIPEGGVHIVGGRDGDAFIQFSTDEDARLAMRLDGKRLQESKLHLLLSSQKEMQKVIDKARNDYAAGIAPTFGRGNAGSDEDAQQSSSLINRHHQSSRSRSRSASRERERRLNTSDYNGDVYGSQTNSRLTMATNQSPSTDPRRATGVNEQPTAPPPLLDAAPSFGSTTSNYSSSLQFSTNHQKQPEFHQSLPFDLFGQQQQSAGSNFASSPADLLQRSSTKLPFTAHGIQQQQQNVNSVAQFNPAAVNSYGAFSSKSSVASFPPTFQPVDRRTPPPTTLTYQQTTQGDCVEMHQQLLGRNAQNLQQPTVTPGHFTPGGHFNSNAMPPLMPPFAPHLANAQCPPDFDPRFQMMPPGQLRATGNQPSFPFQPAPLLSMPTPFNPSGMPPIPPQQPFMPPSSLPSAQSFTPSVAPLLPQPLGGPPPYHQPTLAPSFEQQRFAAAAPPPLSFPLLPLPQSPASASTPQQQQGVGRRSRSALLPAPDGTPDGYRPLDPSHDFPPPNAAVFQMGTPKFDRFSADFGHVSQHGGASAAFNHAKLPMSHHGAPLLAQPSMQHQQTSLDLGPPSSSGQAPSTQNFQPPLHHQQPQPHQPYPAWDNSPVQAPKPAFDKSIFREGVFMDDVQFSLAALNQRQHISYEPNAAVCADNVPKDILRYGSVRDFFTPLRLEGPDSIKIVPPLDQSHRNATGRVYCRFSTAYEVQLALRLDGKSGVRLRPCSDAEFDSVPDRGVGGLTSNAEHAPVALLPNFHKESRTSGNDRYFVEISNIGYKTSDAELWSFLNNTRPRSLKRKMVFKNDRMVQSDTAFAEYIIEKDAEEALNLGGRSLDDRNLTLRYSSCEAVRSCSIRAYEPRRSPDYTAPGAGTSRRSPDCTTSLTSSRGDRQRSPLLRRERRRSRERSRKRRFSRDRATSPTTSSDKSSRRGGEEKRQRGSRSGEYEKTRGFDYRDKEKNSGTTRTNVPKSKDASSKDKDFRYEAKSKRSDDRKPSLYENKQMKNGENLSLTMSSDLSKSSPVGLAPILQDSPMTHRLFDVKPAVQSSSSASNDLSQQQAAAGFTCLFMSGLGPSVQVRDILAFFQNFRPLPGGVRLMRGSAYVEFLSARDCDLAFKAKNRQYMGVQMVTLRACTKNEMVEGVQKQHSLTSSQPVTTVPVDHSVKDPPPPSSVRHEPTAPSLDRQPVCLQTSIQKQSPPSLMASFQQPPPASVSSHEKVQIPSLLTSCFNTPFLPRENFLSTSRQNGSGCGLLGREPPTVTAKPEISTEVASTPNGQMTGQENGVPPIDPAVVSALGSTGCVCFLQNLPPGVSLEEICALFGRHRLVEDSVRMHYSQQSGQATGNCLLAFSSAEDARAACEATFNKQLQGRPLRMWVV